MSAAHLCCAASGTEGSHLNVDHVSLPLIGRYRFDCVVSTPIYDCDSECAASQ